MEAVINLERIAAAARTFSQQALSITPSSTNSSPGISPDDMELLDVCYPCEARAGVDARGEARFTPTGDHKSDDAVLELVRRLSSARAAPGAFKWS